MKKNSHYKIYLINLFDLMSKNKIKHLFSMRLIMYSVLGE